MICSEFAGAAEALDAALLINPYDTEGVADTLKHAIEMSPEEKAHHIARRHMHLAEHNIYKWLAAIFTTLEHIQGASDGATKAAVAPQGGGLGAGTVRETWAVGRPRCSPASAACHPTRP